MGIPYAHPCTRQQPEDPGSAHLLLSAESIVVHLRPCWLDGISSCAAVPVVVGALLPSQPGRRKTAPTRLPAEPVAGRQPGNAPKKPTAASNAPPTTAKTPCGRMVLGWGAPQQPPGAPTGMYRSWCGAAIAPLEYNVLVAAPGASLIHYNYINILYNTYPG